MRTPSLVRVVRVAALAAIYYLVGSLGLRLDAVSGFAAPVWPPTGIALASILLLGNSVWPGVTIGALLVNLSAGASFLGASGMATGNTLEAVLGAYLVRRAAAGRPSLERLRDVVAWCGLAAIVSTVVSATIGVTSGWLTGAVRPALYRPAWSAWWLGDALGDLTVAPFLFIWGSRPRLRTSSLRIAEAIALTAATVIVGLVVFCGLGSGRAAPLPYLLFPFLIWSALRFGQPGAVTTLFVVVAVATWGTVEGLGPFVGGTRHENLVTLQLFLGVVALTTLVLGASVSEREEAEQALRASQKELTEADRAKDQFLAVLAHELRNPLAATANAVELLKLQEPTEAPARRAREIIERQLAHQTRLIDELLDVFRIARGKISLQVSRLDLARLVRDTVEDHRGSVEAADLHLTVEAPAEPAWVEGDPTRLAQVVGNLLQNAVKFSEAGGEITVRVKSARQAGRVVVTVEDTGVGIEAEMLSRIFEPFTQVDGSLENGGGGLGLGLALVRGLVELHGGEVLAESGGPGRGARLTFRLPAAPGKTR